MEIQRIKETGVAKIVEEARPPVGPGSPVAITKHETWLLKMFVFITIEFS